MNSGRTLTKRPARPSRSSRPAARSRRDHTQRETLVGLRLNKIGRVAELVDTPQTRGMIAKVAHLVRVVEKSHEASRTGRPRRRPQGAQTHRPRHRLRQRQDRRPRRQGSDRAFGRAYQGLRGRPDAAASPPAQARLQEHGVRAQAQRDQSRALAGGDRCRPARRAGQDRCRGVGQGRHFAPRQRWRAAARRRRTQGQDCAVGVRCVEIGGRRGGKGRRLGRDSRSQAESRAEQAA